MKKQLLSAAILFAMCVGLSTASADVSTKKHSGKQVAVAIEKGSIPDQYHFSPAIRAGGFIYLSGVVAELSKGADGKLLEASEKNLEVAYEVAFKAIEKTLIEAGSSWDDVVDMTTYHTDLLGQANTIALVKDRYVSFPYPAWTAIDIDALFSEGGVTEIKVIAYSPK